MRRRGQAGNGRLPVLPRVIFVDWHGVLSHQRYWASVRDHPMVVASLDLDRALAALFSDEDVIDSWMRGHRTTREIVAQYLVGESDPALVAFLEQQVIRECAESPIDDQLTQTLRVLKPRRHLVLATDNMDCFATALPRRGDLPTVFDDFLVSSELGVLKGEDPRFFLPWLEDHQLAFSDALLIDDKRTNCDRFREYGGQALVFDGTPATWAQLAAIGTA